MDEFNFADKNTLLVKALVGSRLGGWNEGDSDWDWRGVTMLPKSYYSNPFNRTVPDAVEVSKSPDYVVYSAKHFFEKCAEGATNLVELLHSNMFDFVSDGWEMVKENRKLFYSKKWVGKFFGHSLGEWTQFEKTGDFKCAMNSLRLLGEAYDFLENGKLTFPVYNTHELRKVRSGFYPKSTLEQWRREKMEQVRNLEDKSGRWLKDKPDYPELVKLYNDLYDWMYNSV